MDPLISSSKQTARQARDMARERELAGRILGSLPAVVSLGLIFVHGFDVMKVDQISIYLLVMSSLPFLATSLTSVKASGFEIGFRDLPISEQIFTFLDGIASKQAWTFFSPRPGESTMGAAFAHLTEELIKHDRRRIVAQLRVWLGSDDVNQRWFATEIAGYHGMSELYGALKRIVDEKNEDEAWDEWELNCLWALARLQEPRYHGLSEMLLVTTDPRNQQWILKAYDQMIESGFEKASTFADTITRFVERLSAEKVPPSDIQRRFAGVRNLHSALPAELRP